MTGLIWKVFIGAVGRDTSKSKVQYEEVKPLRASTDDADTEPPHVANLALEYRKNKTQIFSIFFAFGLLWVLSLLLAVHLSQRKCGQYSFERGYKTDLDPIRSAITVRTVRFKGTLKYDDNDTLVSTHDRYPDAIQYVGEPSDRIDQAWADLIEADGADLDGAEADTIRGKTLRKPSGHWLIGIDGFHQIHCLNMLRKGLRPDYYTERDPEPIYSTHLNHCLDYLRQALMCNIDLTPLPITWNEAHHRPMADMEVEHTCRDFQQVREWVVQRNGLNHPFK